MKACPALYAHLVADETDVCARAFCANVLLDVAQAPPTRRVAFVVAAALRRAEEEEEEEEEEERKRREA